MTALSVDSATTVLHAGIDRSVDDVLCSGDIGLHRLERVVLGGDDLLHRGGMDDDIGSLSGAQQSLRIPDVADEVAEPVPVEALLHLGLLEFVAREDADRAVGEFRQDPSDKGVAE